MRRTGIVLLAVFALVAAGCGNDDDTDSAATTVATTTTIAGPKIHATAPATIAAGQPLSIDVTVEGVQLIKADGDASGRTGHLHALVDKDVVAGQAIPAGDPAIIHSAVSPIVVNGLTAGKHTIKIVLGNGLHVPFNPPVVDQVVVTVT